MNKPKEQAQNQLEHFEPLDKQYSDRGSSALSVSKEVLWTKNFVLLIVVNLIMFVSFQLYPPALPPYLKSLGVEESLLGWYTALTTIAAFLVRPFVGVMLDSFGRKYIFLSGLIFVSIIVALMYFLPYAIPLLFLRFFHGIGWGAITTSAATVATDSIPKKRMGEGIGYFSLSISLSLAIGPAIALALPMEKLLEFSIYLMVVATVLAMFLKYQESVHNKHMQADQSDFQYEKEQKKIRFALEKTSLMPTAIICITNIGFGAVVTFIVIYSKSKGIENISSYYVIYALMLMVTRPLIGKLVDKNRYVFTMLLGIFSLVTALVSIACADTLLLFDLSAVFYGLGQGAVMTTAQTLAVVHAPKEHRGMANATFSMGFDVGLSAGAVFSGMFVTWFDYSGMFLCMTFAPLCAAVFFLLAYKRKAFSPRV